MVAIQYRKENAQNIEKSKDGLQVVKMCLKVESRMSSLQDNSLWGYHIMAGSTLELIVRHVQCLQIN